MSYILIGCMLEGHIHDKRLNLGSGVGGSAAE